MIAALPPQQRTHIVICFYICVSARDSAQARSAFGTRVVDACIVFNNAHI